MTGGLLCLWVSMEILSMDDMWFAGWQVWQSCRWMTGGLLGNKYGNTVDG